MCCLRPLSPVVTCCSRRTHPSDTLPFLSSLASLRTALSTVGFQRKGTGSLNYRRQPRSLACAGTLAVWGPRGRTESQPLRQDATRSFTRGELLAPRLRGAPRPGGFTVSSPAPPLPSPFHFNFSSFSNLCIPSPGGEVARLRPHAPLPPGQETQGGGAATAFRAHQPRALLACGRPRGRRSTLQTHSLNFIKPFASDL